MHFGVDAILVSLTLLAFNDVLHTLTLSVVFLTALVRLYKVFKNSKDKNSIL